MMAVAVAAAAIAVYRPAEQIMPERSDAVLVFAGERARNRLALELVGGGMSDVLVVSYGSSYPGIAERCGEQTPVEVICIVPEESSTRSEAAAFGHLVEQRGWGSVVAVTGDYHQARASLWASRCIDADVTFVSVDWPAPRLGTALHEIGGLLAGWTFQRSC
jgi:uncharacterized SAM-binding protein YcdF (DUF218 family)